ncbi:MAG: recombinase family protein [Desulfuromonadaceae bacterium]|nr:recombinase family protein [Desulfuromonadaceae bacterium]
MARVGYARVSSRDQNLDSQIDMLTATGCEKIFEDKISGVKESRPEWDRLLEFLRPGDTIVVAELSRMTRSLMHLLSLVKKFERQGIEIVSLREHIDSSTATGRAFLSILGAINQMERELKSERAAAGRASAKARGRTGGRPRTDLSKLENARVLYENSGASSANVCTTFGISRRTFFNYLAECRKGKEIPVSPHQSV